MSSTPKPPPDSPDWTRRALLGAGAAALAVGSATTRANPAAATETRPDEWRNKQPGMAYRRLGRTGLMVSEVVSGGDPIDLANYRHLALAVEMGRRGRRQVEIVNSPETHYRQVNEVYENLLRGEPVSQPAPAVVPEPLEIVLPKPVAWSQVKVPPIPTPLASTVSVPRK